jgi:hypothetical protein
MLRINGSSLLKWALPFLLLSTLCITPVKAEDDAEPVTIILFMFFGLMIGILIMQVLSALGDPVPYTCVVFLSGIIFSLFNKHNSGVLLCIYVYF